MNDFMHDLKDRAVTFATGEWAVIRLNGTILLGNIGTWALNLDMWTKVAALLLTIVSVFYTGIKGAIEWQKLKKLMDDDPANDPED